MKNIFIATLVVCLNIVNAHTQNYQMTNLNVEDGLSNNYVKDIAQDAQGFIWIATETGLNRFDGENFTIYNSANSNLQNDAINTLLYDKEENQLWIGTKTILSVLNCSTLEIKNFHGDETIPLNNIVHLSQAGDNIWIANHNDGIVHYSKKTKQFTCYADKLKKELNNSNWCTFDDGKGHLYVGHAQCGLSIINIAEQTVRHFKQEAGNPHSLPGNSVYSICIDHKDNLWIGTNQGLALFNPKKENFTVFKHEPDKPNSLIADHIYDIKEMSDGTLWIAADIGGISILDLYDLSFANTETIKFTNITAAFQNNDLSSRNIRSLLQDSFGNIWIGNYSSGVDVINHTTSFFQTLPYKLAKANKVRSKPVWGIFADDKQQVWIGSENEIALFKNNQLKYTVDISNYQSRPYSQIFSMHGTQHGCLLLGLYDDGLLEYNTKTKNIRRIDLGMDNIDIITFYEATDGTIWIGAEYGIYTYKNGVINTEEKITDQLSDRSVYGILYDNQGKIWIGTYGGGIYIFNQNHDLIQRLSSGTGFFSNAINYLYSDSKGGIWVATREGLGYIKDTSQPNVFENYGTKEGLSDLFVRSVQEDQFGDIWISTNQAISLWDKNKKQFKNYNRFDGIPAGNFIEGSSCLTSNGTVYFGSLNGVCYFNPREVITEHPVSPIQIIECKVYDRNGKHEDREFLVPVGNGKIDLEYNQNSFRILFSVPDYAQNKQAEYAYMIEGVDDVWTHTARESQVTFRNLSPGTYTFKVKARLKNQEWNENHIATIQLRILPPLWLTWYAKLFYSLLAMFVIYILIRFYKRKLDDKSKLEIERKNSLNEQKLNEERLRFYTNITHELRTPLTLILGPLEDLTTDEKFPKPYSNTIQTIHKSAIRLLNLINQLLEFRKTETQNRKLAVAKGDIASLLTEIGLRYKDLNRNAALKFKIHVATESTVLYFDPEIITMILNNLLSNAVKNTPEGEISLTLDTVFEADTEYTEIKVSDTGCGIEAEVLPHIFERYYQVEGNRQVSGTGIGLALVKSLAILHEGKLNVDSEVGKGTIFTFCLQTANTYPNAIRKEKEEQSVFTEINNEESREKDINNAHPVLLVVEDDNDIRKYIQTSFSKDFKVIEADNGKDGLQKALATIPDIIVSDIMMPEMDGIEFCRIIKEEVHTSHIPVILLTAKDSLQDQKEGYESGADSYLTKPFSANLLRSRIFNLLESRAKLARQIARNPNDPECSSNEGSDEKVQISKLDKEFLDKITKIIEANIDKEKLDILFFTQKINMSHSTFYRKLKGLTGITPNEFIRKVRLKNSRILLKTGDYNVSETAYMTGFNSLRYFRDCFKEEYGISPSDYVRNSKKEKEKV
jgi:signal transduction histidine kinase/DNA-binding response OmpR family regulator/streptogramin lyase